MREMKTLRFLSLIFLAAAPFSGAQAQTATNAPAAAKPHIVDVPQPGQDTAAPAPAPAPTSSKPLTPEQVAAYQQRFQQGYDLQQAGKLAEALAIYEGILKEQPDAKRSLLEAGRISLKLNNPTKADTYLSQLHQLEPTFPEAVELLIQANQALKHDVKVAILIKQFQELHKTTDNPAFAQSPGFVREQIRLDNGDTILFTQFFDYTQDPNLAWQAQLIGPDEAVKRQLNLFYDAKAAKDLQSSDPKLSNAAQFILAESVIKDGQVVRVDAYFQMFTLPEYKKVRNSMLAIFSGTYKPVYSQNVAPAGQ